LFTRGIWMLKDSLADGVSPLFACAPALPSYRDHKNQTLPFIHLWHSMFPAEVSPHIFWN
jgi:hypothetical protein